MHPLTEPLIRPVAVSDLPRYWDHVGRLMKENVAGPGPIFAPHQSWERTLEEFSSGKPEAWAREVTQCGWERCWVLMTGAGIVGHVKLIHTTGLPTALHRATLMMGIERSHQSQGHGKLMLAQALNWAREQPSLEWIQLNVFSHNTQARRLYRNAGFTEQGTTPDHFRVCGQKIDDIQMAFALNRSARGR